MFISNTATSTLAKDGGDPVRTTSWPTYDKGDRLLETADTEAALRALRSQRLFRYDTRPYNETEVGQFEQEIARYFVAPYTLAVSSGTASGNI